MDETRLDEAVASLKRQVAQAEMYYEANTYAGGRFPDNLPDADISIELEAAQELIEAVDSLRRNQVPDGMEVVDCMPCGGKGWDAYGSPSDGWEQVQCEACLGTGKVLQQRAERPKGE